MVFFKNTPPTPAELRAGDLAALHNLLNLLEWSIYLALACGLYLVLRSGKLHGHHSLGKSFWVWISASMSFFAIFMPFSFMIMFAEPLSKSLPGLSILFGLSGIASVGITRLIHIWEKRREQVD